MRSDRVNLSRLHGCSTPACRPLPWQVPEHACAPLARARRQLHWHKPVLCSSAGCVGALGSHVLLPVAALWPCRRAPLAHVTPHTRRFSTPLLVCVLSWPAAAPHPPIHARFLAQRDTTKLKHPGCRRLTPYAHRRHPAPAGCVGSSEACYLAGLAMKKQWQARRRGRGLPADRPNIVLSHVAQVCWQKVSACRFPLCAFVPAAHVPNSPLCAVFRAAARRSLRPG